MTNQYLIKKSILLFWKMYLSLSNNFFFSWLVWSQIFQEKFYGYINFVMIGIVCWLDFISFLLFLHKLWTCKDKDCARNDVTKLGFNKRSLSLLLIFIYDDRWCDFGTGCNLTPQNSLSASTSFNSGLRSICPRVKSPIKRPPFLNTLIPHSIKLLWNLCGNAFWEGTSNILHCFHCAAQSDCSKFSLKKVSLFTSRKRPPVVYNKNI